MSDFYDQPGWKDLIASGGIVGSPDAPPPVADVIIGPRINGLNEPMHYGSYIRLVMEVDGKSKTFRISEGCAEEILAILKGLLEEND